MCGGGGAARAASDAAAAEAARQAQLEKERLAQEAAAAKAEADRRYAEEQARYQAQIDAQKADAEAMRKQLEEQAAATLAAQQKIEEQRKVERDADLARQEKLRTDELARQEAIRKASEDKATANAKTLSTYSTDRQALIDKARTGVEGAFAPYDDNFFSKYAHDYTDYYKPQLDQQYDDAKRATTFSFANKGTLNSTAAARQFGRLDQQRTAAGADIAQKAESAASAFHGDIDQQRSQLLSSIFGAASSAPPITVDSIGEANNSLKQLSGVLNSPVNLAASAAGSITPPAYATLVSPFKVPTAAAPRTISAGTGANGAYTTSGGSSGRLVG